MSIEIRGLSKSFGKKQVLQELDLTIETGQCYCLLGKNGVGKSTFLNCILDLMQPDAGTITLLGKDYKAQPLDIKQNLGALCEDNPLIEEFTGLEYLTFVSKLHRLSPAESEERISSLTNYFFSDPESLQKNIAGYSTGMKKKVGIAAAILHKPQILILDEPFTGLDPIAAQLLVKLIRSYSTQNRAVLISSHDLNYVEKVATHIGVLNDGQLMYNGSVQEFTMNGENLIDQALFQLLLPHHNTDTNLDWVLG
ncbi:ABC-2 type transport system ATP-binding protein [Pontibacter ummariensis]|uniref:ABC-2 type transport system ATP-binding protein n=1 Tax=Pontibacter ummariensis TaxID=1610492 RepID=A0A239J736_9BACT|nr:ABC transporter ATP-binding protein [Pontibacter ummariensis]PRY08890.1 ABC-2 type transport system ATP-binding protein [Pontibacter ummariensis]SNT01063.1 ABC-2 type transport system ATP-binding protein [Pontibacter ummariensis]